MRIFYAADSSPNSEFESNIWRNNLYLTLVEMGHDVVEFDYDLREPFRNLDPSFPQQQQFIALNRPLISNELISQIKSAHRQQPIDLFFSYFYSACVFPKVIDEIKSLGIVTINWYCNASYQFHLVSEIAPHYDWCLVPEKFRLKDYEAIGARPIYCQEAANPTFYKYENINQDIDVSFVGTAYGERPWFINYLVNHKIKLKVFGKGWDHFTDKQNAHANVRPAEFNLKKSSKKLMRSMIAFCNPFRSRINYGRDIKLTKEIYGGVLTDEEVCQVFRRSKINLGFSTCGATHLTEEPIHQVRLRDFEVPMCGGFYLVKYAEEIEEFFTVGREIVCYHNHRDLLRKIRYYLRHDAEREAIRMAGHKRCARDHTWRNRFTMVFEKIGMNKINL